jgi:hypothetical protein
MYNIIKYLLLSCLFQEQKLNVLVSFSSRNMHFSMHTVITCTCILKKNKRVVGMGFSDFDYNQRGRPLLNAETNTWDLFEKTNQIYLPILQRLQVVTSKIYNFVSLITLLALH